jgi:hypothetical protein
MTEKKPNIYITTNKISAEELDYRVALMKDMIADMIEDGDLEIDDAVELILYADSGEIALMTDGTPDLGFSDDRRCMGRTVATLIHTTARRQPADHQRLPPRS